MPSTPARKRSLPSLRPSPAVARFLADYGMLGVLVLLCVYYSAATIEEQHATSEGAAQGMVGRLTQAYRAPGYVVIVTKDRGDDRSFADALGQGLEAAGFRVVAKIHGQPPMVERAVEDLVGTGAPIDCFATTLDYQLVVGNVLKQFPRLGSVAVQVPETYRWPTFLERENLRNLTHQFVVLAVIGVGMTLVIFTGGIDLSVGSLVALSAVTATSLIVWFGGTQASTLAMLAACLAAIGLCGMVGAFSGAMIARLALPPFIVTLAVMLIARGLAFLITSGDSVEQLPDGFSWLGRGADLLVIPNAVVLMAILYFTAHLLLTRTNYGRSLYAVGGNRQAAKPADAETARVLLVVYVVSGMMAGLGGVIEASQFKAGSATYGDMDELYVIAAVLIGGTSLSGGEGRVLGTLIGALAIAVLQNGMDLTKVEGYTQMVVLGLVILGAVSLDVIKKRGWRGVVTAE